jgi:transcriptional adapter 2-alpha
MAAQKLECSYCFRDVKSQFHIICADPECITSEYHKNNGVRLCSDCLSAGPNLCLPPHKFSHSYRVSDCLEFPIFSKDWTASDELALLDGINHKEHF